MTEMTTGPCVDCRAPAERERMTGFGSEYFNDFPLRCTRCDAAKSAQWDAEAAEREAEQLRHAKQHRLSVAEIPAMLADIDMDALDHGGCADAIAAARYWAVKGGGLLLTGPFGVGKTTIAAGALRLTLEKRFGRWMSAPLMMARLGSGLDSAERARTIATLTGTSALVLDDLDKTRPTEYGAEQIFLVVDGAVTSGRPLLVTTNLGLGQLAAKWPAPFGEAIASRLAGYCTLVALSGADRRLGEAA